jgi:RNA polymerase sigma-70 factor (ECF subfamily)
VGHAGAADSPDILDLEPATHRQSPGCEAVVEDAELLARISAGEQQALELLHERFATGMYSVAMRVTRSERLSQEAVQDAFMAVWQDPLRFDPARGSLGPWLFTLARFKAIDAVRREAAVKRQTAEVDLELYEAPDNVHDEVWRGLRRERLNTAINLLPEDQRRALSLAFIQGLTHVEVAEREGIPLGTAKTRIRTALLRLRASLETDLSEVESTGESPGDGGIPRGVPGPADRMRARGDAAGRTRSGLARCAIRFGSVIEQALKLTRFVTAPFGAGLTAAAGGSI